MRPSEESEKVLENVKTQTSRKKNSPNEGDKTEQTCPRMGHVEDRPKYSIAPKATSLETQ